MNARPAPWNSTDARPSHDDCQISTVAALIGGTIAATVFRHKVHIGYLAAIVAASNGGGSGSVITGSNRRRLSSTSLM